MKRMSKNIKCFLGIVIYILIFCLCVPMSAVVGTGFSEGVYVKQSSGYLYPITPDSDEWEEYTVLEKVELLRIPQHILDRMTDEELVNAIASYPYLIDIYCYGEKVIDGIEVSRSYFSALDELLSRETGTQSLAEFGVKKANNYYTNYSTRGSDDGLRDLFVANALMDILNAQTDAPENAVANRRSSTVEVYIGQELHTAAVHRAWDQEILRVYNATLVSSGTCLYNCHSYAWYSQSTSNSYVILDPTPFMDSGNYSRIYLGGLGTQSNSTSIKYGDIIFYGDINAYNAAQTEAQKRALMETWHSAIYISTTVSGIPLANQMCISKWGANGVYKHQMGIVPAGYNVTCITAWRER